MFFALALPAATAVWAGSGGSGRLGDEKAAERGVSPGTEVSELRTHLMSPVGNKEKPEPKAKEEGIPTPFTSFRPVLGNKEASWF